jgi:hypothetical protein
MNVMSLINHFLLCAALSGGGLAIAQDQTPVSAPPILEIQARMVAARPLIRPGEWFPVLFEITSNEPGAVFLGPPDDGLNPLEGAAETDTRLSWNTEEGQEFKLVPDLTSIQWPRPRAGESTKDGLMTLPARIYVPVKVVSETPLGPVEISFTLDAVRSTGEPGVFDLENPIRLQEKVSIEIVHPTDPEATNLKTEDPSLFFAWHGDLPAWSVHDARESGPKKSAPTLAWVVVFTPFTLVGLALIWAFATGRM